MFEFLDVFIIGAILYYIVQAVRRAASAQTDKRAPGSIAREDGESLSWSERTQRALEGALEWEEEQQRKREEAELRAELAAVRAQERGGSTPWGARRDEHRRQLEEARSERGAAPSLSDALAGVASMLEQHAASQQRRDAEPFRPPARRGDRELTTRARPAPPARREPAAVSRRSKSASGESVLEVEAVEVRDDVPTVRRPTTGALTDLPSLGRLTPLQRAIVYGEIFGRPVALGGGTLDDLPD